MVSVDFGVRQTKHLVLFDVDDTLTLARQKVTPDMIDVLRKLKEKAVIGFVGGSDLNKIVEQLSLDGLDALNFFDFGFAENGLTPFRLGQPLPANSFIEYLNEQRYKELVNFILRYLSEVDVPIKRGTFVEFRKGMINVSPIGRNATIQERIDFEKYDKEHQIRKKFIAALKEKFASESNNFGLTYSIGGQISFDVFPNGWDKTYCLKFIPEGEFEEIHFFGDKTYEGGNDYEIFTHSRVKGHAVKKPVDTMNILSELYKIPLQK